MTRSPALFRLAVLPLLAGLWAATTPAAHAAPPPNFNGSYELAGNRVDRLFNLEIHQTGTRAKISFSATMADGTGPAPDAEGAGEIEDGVLSFKFKDSFDNEGACKLQPRRGSYELDMVITKMVEASPLHFYGTLLLKKTSDHPISP
jgi:hypothetical protein